MAEVSEVLSPLDRLLGVVHEAMTSEVLTLPLRMKASEAARKLEERGITGAPVVEHGRMVGVFSLSDSMETAGPTWQTSGPFLRHEHTLADIEVGEIMSRDVITADPEWSLAQAARVMESERVNRLPVVDALLRPIGILTRDDIVRAVARHAPD